MRKPSKRSQAATNAARSAEKAHEVDVAPVAVSGHLADRLTIVTQTSTQLVTGIGSTTAGEAVLVPYVDVQVFSLAIEEAESRPVYEPLLGLENFAFILASMSLDGVTACQQLTQMSGGSLRPDQARMRQATEFFEAAIASLQGCVSSLSELTRTPVPALRDR